MIREFRRTFKTGEPYVRQEHLERRRDRGVVECHEWRVQRIGLRDGRHGVVCYIRDISSQVSARERLRAEERQKDEFLGTLGHELRNPLGPIQNASELLMRVRSFNDSIQKIAGSIKRQATHMARLVDDLLDLSQATQGRLELRSETVAVVEVVNRAIEMVLPLIREKKHDLKYTTGGEPVRVNGDVTRLTQVFANVLTNAAKYTPEGGELRVNVRHDGDRAIIEICDNGMGIASDALPHVFELFVQDKRTVDSAQGGIGIGLNVARRVVEMHGGTITVHSQGVGAGASFRIELPCSHSAEDEQQHATQKVMSRPRRVLIVDDNEDAADVLAMLLKEAGHTTEAVYSAEKALQRVTAFGAGAAFVDISLPGMNGYELARHLRASGCTIRLIALTGHARGEDVQRSRAAGFDAHLVKPVDLPELERQLAEA
jgi:signal transduction histidine kinase